MNSKAVSANLSESASSSWNIAARLLSIAPALVANQALPAHGLLEVQGSDEPHPARMAKRLAALLGETLKGEVPSVQASLQVIESVPRLPVTPALSLTAAFDLIHREIQECGDERLREFVLSAHHARFEVPELIKALTREFPISPNSPLAQANVLACRHLLGSTVAEIDALRHLLPNARFFEVMGKPYSANSLAVDALRHRDIEVRIESCEMPDLSRQPIGAFAHRHRRIARSVVDRFVREHGRSSTPLLVIDDGGALINAVGQQVIAGKLRCPVVAIEQTTHGMFAVQEFLQKPEAQRAGFALVSVADSVTKLRDESPLIARSVIDCVDHWFDVLRDAGYREKRASLTGSNIGIIGYGPVGARIAKELARCAEVNVYDLNRRKLILAHAASCEPAWSLQDLLSKSDVVIAASGGTSIDSEASQYLQDGTVLVSASSGDLEFSGLSDWSTEIVPLLPTTASTRFDRTHGLLKAAHQDGRTVYVLNRGFPVNFDGRLDPIAEQEIQLTRALMVGGLIQAAGTHGASSLVGRTEKVPLDWTIDQFLAGEFQRLTGAMCNESRPSRGTRTSHRSL